jgi:hypothetical protein
VLESKPPPVSTDAHDHAGRDPNRNDAARAATPTASSASATAEPARDDRSQVGVQHMHPNGEVRRRRPKDHRASVPPHARHAICPAARSVSVCGANLLVKRQDPLNMLLVLGHETADFIVLVQVDLLRIRPPYCATRSSTLSTSLYA